MRRIPGFVAAAVAVIGLWATGAAAQDFPSRAITLIVPYAPGGAVDGTARMLAIELTKTLGQTVVVENKPGAAGMIGVVQLKRAAADGHTILIDTPAIVMNLAIHRKPQYEAADLAPVAQVMQMPYVVAMGPTVGSSYQDLVARMKSAPSGLNVASSGTSSRLFAELFALQTGTRFVHIGYPGAAPALMSVMKDETQITAMDVPNIEPFITSGRLKGAVITGNRRSTTLPEVPSAAEVGIPGFDAATWYGIFAPAQTPAAVLERLNGALRQVTRTPAMATFMGARGAQPVDQSVAEFGAFYRSEVERWRAVIEKAGIELQ
ncbi:MAG: Bug family tripartite tricarboxylate transporter substrate binding protein [Lautropia sp.]